MAGRSLLRLSAAELGKITREHILQALQDLSQGVGHDFGPSTDYDLLYADGRFAPKAVFGVAARYALGQVLKPEHFSGGEDSTCFRVLRREGFEIVPKYRAFLLTWNPIHFPESGFQKELDDYRDGKAEGVPWSVGHRKDLPSGSTLVLMRLGVEPKGIVGLATSVGSVEEGDHWDSGKSGRKALYTMAIPDRMQLEPYIPLAVLEEKWPDFDWTPQASGVEIHDPDIIRVLSKVAVSGALIPEISGALAPGKIEPTADPERLALMGQALQGKIWRTPPPGQKHPEKVSQPVGTSYKRDPEVISFALSRAAGYCNLCGSTAPFKRPDGSWFLEVHHVIHLADDGPDTPGNTVALCPNCHRAMHHSSAPDRLVKALYARCLFLDSPQTE